MSLADATQNQRAGIYRYDLATCNCRVWWGRLKPAQGHTHIQISSSSGPKVVHHIPPKITFYFSTTTRNLGNRTLPVDRADEIESIDSVRAKNTFFLANEQALKKKSRSNRSGLIIAEHLQLYSSTSPRPKRKKRGKCRKDENKKKSHTNRCRCNTSDTGGG